MELKERYQLKTREELLDPRIGSDATYPLGKNTQRKYKTGECIKCNWYIVDVESGEIHDMAKKEHNRMIMGDMDKGDCAYVFMHPSGNIILQALRKEKGVDFSGEEIGQNLRLVHPEDEFYTLNVGDHRWRFLRKCYSKK